MRNLEYLGEKAGNYHSIVKLFEHLKRDKKSGLLELFGRWSRHFDRK